MTTISKTLSGAALAAVVASATTLAPAPALAWKKSSDAELVNRMIHALAPGSRGYKRHYHHRKQYNGWKRKRYGWAPKKHYGYKFKHHDHHRGYVGYDGRFHTGFANRYGWGKSAWIYKSRHVGHLDLQVFFRSGSAKLSHRAYRVLDSLGDALSYGKLRYSYFLIGGHTDAAGSYESNRYLSKRRAQTVKNYLTRHFHIAPRRLVTVGYGEERLAYPGHPYSKKNRRVEVSVISKAKARRIRNRHYEDDYARYDDQY